MFSRGGRCDGCWCPGVDSKHLADPEARIRSVLCIVRYMDRLMVIFIIYTRIHSVLYTDVPSRIVPIHLYLHALVL